MEDIFKARVIQLYYEARTLKKWIQIILFQRLILLEKLHAEALVHSLQHMLLEKNSNFISDHLKVLAHETRVSHKKMITDSDLCPKVMGPKVACETAPRSCSLVKERLKKKNQKKQI